MIKSREFNDDGEELIFNDGVAEGRRLQKIKDDKFDNKDKELDAKLNQEIGYAKAIADVEKKIDDLDYIGLILKEELKQSISELEK
jgi:hypothetical protein